MTYGADREPRDPDEAVLLLGRLPRPCAHDEPDVLRDLERSIRPRGERNTLVAAASAIAAAQRAGAHGARR